MESKRPTSVQHPLPCPAQDKGFDGSSCTEDACAQRCRFTTPRDPLARLIHYSGSNQEGVEEHYGSRKNAVEGRTSQITRLGLKRIWSYGLPGATADLAFADLLINLRTLGRLVQQATLLTT